MKKVLALILAICLVFSCAATAMATDALNAAVVDSAVRPEEPPLTVKVVDKVEFKELPNLDIADLSMASNLQPDEFPTPNLKLSDTPTFTLNKPSTYALGDAYTQSFSGAITTEGTFQYVTFALQPNQIVQASMLCPNNPNLNYDLFLYEFNAAGALISPPLTASTYLTKINTYPDGTVKTVDEGIGYINNTAAPKNLAVIINATQGSSATDTYTVTISLDADGNTDAAEPNESAFTAYGVVDGTLRGTTLSASNDQDWFVWNVPSEFKSASISAVASNSAANYDVDVYSANGTTMTVLPREEYNKEYTLNPGYYYICVTSKRGAAFVPSAYELRIVPHDVVPATIEVYMNGDEGPVYPQYPEGSTYLRVTNYLKPEVYIKSASGYPVSNQQVLLYWESETWREGLPEHSKTQTVSTSGGVAKFNLELPTALGKHSYILSDSITAFKHHYDIDGVAITVPGTNLSYTTVIYHFMYSEYL